MEGNSEYGIRYGYIMELKDPNRKKAKVVIAWIRENGKLRLTIVYITGRKGTE